MSELHDLSLAQASHLIQTVGISSVELTQACLERIERLNPTLNTFAKVTAHEALFQAKRRDEERHQGQGRGPLHGIPIALKDNIDTAGVRTTAASAQFAHRVPDEDAEVVRQLKNDGAVILGKLNLHEFAYGTTSLVSHYGPVRNPWDPERIAGGSSGGSAAAVAAGLCYGALGTDTAGSIRLPAACCGIVGLKPTAGLVSARGVIPLSWTFDHVGPMCRTVEDTALLLTALAGYDPQDPASERMELENYWGALRRDMAGLRIGVLDEFVPLPEAQASWKDAVEVFRSLGATVEQAQLPPDTNAAYLPLFMAEVWAYHADLYEQFPERYQPETRARLENQTPVTAAQYIEARHALIRVRRAIEDTFTQFDALIAPTTPGAAPLIRECRHPLSLSPEFTRPFNTLGLPAISIPYGFTQDGLPLGLQIAGPRGGDATVLALAHAYEQATDWHTRRPLLGD